MIIDLYEDRNGLSEEQILHQKAQEITEQTRARANLKREVRSYEVSLWTLQDEFITVLKWSDAEQQNRIEEPKMTIDVDGTQSFTFSVPMYINVMKDDGTKRYMAREENPIWYTIKDERLLLGMRKVKVIFNKMSEDEQIFEFLIVKVTENHEEDKLTCEIECEGLAFHELGKIGYKYALSYETFNQEYEKWVKELCPSDTEPIQNIDFWCKQINLKECPLDSNGQPDISQMSSTTWYYDVQMDWSSYTLISGSGFSRSSKKVYEEAYIIDWDSNLNPVAVEHEREKARSIEISESNVYNITQTMAEQFGIYCRYQYLYDANQHIVGRLVIFYNNYMKEKDKIISFTYPYSSSAISRELDSTDLTTKLYVSTVDDDTLYDGYVSIMNSKVNKTKEDYLLNFEYMYNIGAINKEQYNEIAEFEKQVRAYNEQLTDISLRIATYERKKTELEAKITTYTNSIALDNENISKFNEERKAIGLMDGSNDGLVTVGEVNPEQILLKRNGRTGIYYAIFNQKGIVKSTLKLYYAWNPYADTSKNERIMNRRIKGYEIKRDEYGNIIKANNIKPDPESNYIYAIYQYNPITYYDKIIRSWSAKLDKDTEKLESAQNKLGTEQTSGVLYQLKTLNDSYDSLLEEKNELLRSFEHMMGAALREGYWSPESYQDYGDKHSEIVNFSNISQQIMIDDAGDNAVAGWDDELFDDEQKPYFEEGVNLTKRYYPCINLSQNVTVDGVTKSIFEHIKNEFTSFSFIARTVDTDYIDPDDNNLRDDISLLHVFTLGSQAILRFVRNNQNNKIIPVLLLIGAENLTSDEIDALTEDDYLPRLAKVTTETNQQNEIVTNIDYSISLSSNGCWLALDGTYSVTPDPEDNVKKYSLVYPRIKISNLLFKNTESDLSIIYNNNLLLERYENYSVLNRTTYRESIDYPEYFITLKPETFVANWDITNEAQTVVNFVLSNAGTAIYLDAKDVLKENSEPKVSYTISANVLNLQQVRTAYTLLNQLAMINDAELKFNNVFGYISHLELDLDQPQNDEYEIKNYKTKFEDLFSNIVAQTEEMKKNNDTFSAYSSGYISLNTSGFANTLVTHEATINSMLDQYINNSIALQEKLTQLFTQAGQILSGSTSNLDSLSDINQTNNEILSNLALAVQENIFSKIYTSMAQPINFKTGDIWIKIDNEGHELGTYLAISDSQNCLPGHGFVRTSSGDLASLTGTCIDVDAVAGMINIGTTTINDVTKAASINLVAAGINDQSFASPVSVSSIHINPYEVSLAGAEIKLLTGSNTTSDTSAIELSGTRGIWIGSNRSITLYSGAPSETINNETVNYGANVEINPKHILFGIIGNGSTALEITDAQFILSARETVNNNNNKANGVFKTDHITADSGLTGIQIQPNYIGMATGSGASGDPRSIVSINPSLILIGSATGTITESSFTNGAEGSFVSIAPTGIIIGSGGNLAITTNNVIVNTAATSSNIIFQLKTTSNNTDISVFKYTANGILELNAEKIKIRASANASAQSMSSFLTMSPSDIWAGVKSATSSTSLKLTDNSIALTANDTSFNLSTTGISMSGNNISITGGHVLINGKQEWSREDIVIMNPSASGDDSWRSTVSDIETHMNGKHDWVLIRPYYNGKLVYTGTNVIEDNVYALSLQGIEAAFGDGATWYQYDIEFYCQRTADPSASDNVNQTVYLSTKSDFSENTITFTYQAHLRGAAEKVTISTNQLTGNQRKNLCQDGGKIYIKTTNNATATALLTNITLTCTCSTTNSRVPCTVYYYP